MIRTGFTLLGIVPNGFQAATHANKAESSKSMSTLVLRSSTSSEISYAVLDLFFNKNTKIRNFEESENI